ncbi:RNA 2',3'-cyclic phosphodiesterase [Streptomyces sp. TRM43335]|uniref:RNA 2',3'-cyclic phosphodiesterase n=1 Tax=Streptomyces taklimakanensis TaxID=2569853 RepID=A0A6G2BBH5_9ACTN|nr:RNA 2',3'-cyclic phosphodiesterase [Streptomyces taklimakanensis]MTE19574.1 RNA 2',3'-cyclic phosphodiesterase [Streptomyces taklimakanensis]
MRLFTAVLPPPPAAAELAAAVGALQALPGADRLRWTPAEGRHITLAFLGEVDEDLLPELRERFGRAARRHRPFDARLAGGGRFGDRVLWAGVADGRTALRALADSVSAGARRTGVPIEDRPYRPHLTVARARAGRAPGARRTDLRPFADALADFSGSAWRAGELTLVRSRLPVSGVSGDRPRYETLEVWPLGH